MNPTPKGIEELRAEARGEWSRDYEADLDDLLTSMDKEV